MHNLKSVTGINFNEIAVADGAVNWAYKYR